MRDREGGEREGRKRVGEGIDRMERSRGRQLNAFFAQALDLYYTLITN